MGKAKDIVVKPITEAEGREFIKKVHYSGKCVVNGHLFFGVYYAGRLEGAMQFGSPIDKRKLLGLVEGTGWHGFMELNRMAFSDNLPRNSESRALAIVFRLLKKHAPQIKWIVSFADATQCGDGAIYRASGFYLTGIKRNSQLLKMPDGGIVHRLVFADGNVGATKDKAKYQKPAGVSVTKWAKGAGAVPLEGFQLRYIYFLDPSYKERLTVPILPFSVIDETGAGMYKGVKKTRLADSSNPDPTGRGGATPT